MDRPPIYTIGYGKRSLGELIELLKRYRVDFLIDIRSQPYSRFRPEFSKAALEKPLEMYTIHYIFMGDALGGRPDDETCYVAGKVDYALVRERAFYQQGIARLQTAWQKQLSVVLLCSEARPQDCHRGKLVGNTLVEQQIAVAHIDETGEIKTQEAVNQALTNGQLPLFEQESLITLSGKVGRSRKKRASKGPQ